MKRIGVLFSISSVGVICLSILSCGTSKSHKAQYEAAWNEILQSREWRDALVEEDEQDMVLETYKAALGMG